MELKIRISIDAPRGGLRRLALFVALPLALVASARLVAWAYDTSWIAPGQPLSAAQLKQNLDEVQERLDALEAASGTADCLPGYTKDASVTTFTLCKKGNDQMVKVGTGASAFWVDRYEASVWTVEGGSGMQHGATNGSGNRVNDYPPSFPQNGQRRPGSPAFEPLYATSMAGVQPSASLTWFQAMEACAASGKRLPTGQEWLRAASGTPDPGASDGSGGTCVTTAGGPRATGVGTACASAWGAQDMIGNLWEWTSEWYAGAGASGGSVTPQLVNQGAANWPVGYESAATWNVVTAVYNEPVNKLVAGLPAAALRGGPWLDGPAAGVFALYLNDGPSNRSSFAGFRCVAF